MVHCNKGLTSSVEPSVVHAGEHVIRNLHDTITRLANFRGLGPSEPTLEGKRLSILDDFGSNPGALVAKMYIPASFAAGSPLVVVLHGCTQTAEVYDFGTGWSKAADEHGFALLFPEQRRANNPILCFNWFSAGDAVRGRGEAQSIRNMVAAVHKRFDTDPARVFVTGLSAGGAMTAVMLATYPEVFAGGGVIAGLPFGSANSVPEAFDRMRGHGGPTTERLAELVQSASDHAGPWPTLSIWHGTADTTVAPSNAQDLVDQWRTLHGVAKSPSRKDEVEGMPRRVWCDTAGRAVIEEFRIKGMTPGTPFDISHPEYGEVAGAHMLNAGISSTRHLLRFWGIAPAAPISRAEPKPVEHRPRSTRRSAPHVSQSMGTKVTTAIQDALRAAGLLR